MERLQKYMASCGIASRRASEKMILDGRVKVNSKVVNTLGVIIDSEIDDITVDNKKITRGLRVVFLLNKPCGYVTTSKDPQGRKTVIDLVKDINYKLFAVGRLDINTSGLILMTNDGHLAHKIMHPSFEIDKTYHVTIKNKITNEQINRLEKGIYIDNRITAPAKCKIIVDKPNHTIVEITIHEGRKRQVRKMFKDIGVYVIELKRVKIGFLTDDQLDVGMYRKLSAKEVKELYSIVERCV